jgi:CO dehydrogenase maturation factor
LLDFSAVDAVLHRFAGRIGGGAHLAAGEFDESDIGSSCYYAKTGAVEPRVHQGDWPGARAGGRSAPDVPHRRCWG